MRALHLRTADVSVVLVAAGTGLPRIAHWGAVLGELSAADLDELARVTVPPVVSNTPDVPVQPSIVPTQAEGWLGSGGLRGHRDTGWTTPRFAVRDVAHESESVVEYDAIDEGAGLALRLRVELTREGLLRTRARLTNTGELPYTVDELTPVLAVPARATELLDLTGRHLRERSPQRSPFTLGTHLRESLRGRTGHDASTILAAGTPAFGFRSGEVWAVHVAWSGNHRALAERVPFGDAILAGGEALLPGEVRLAAGESYQTPWLYGSYGAGLDAVAARFHAFLRGRAQHPSSPRPVLLNVWEAVYFDHDLAALERLADLAAEAGVERYVLDDGWFRHRRDDTAGLGDWYVDEGVWPDGLGPLIDHVHARGMQFGLWFEPEMINLDSDLAREHPEWIMAPGDRLPVESRSQQVLNLSIPAAYEHVLARIDAILSEYAIDYVKWDHNRDLIEAATRATGAAAVHEQTLAFYRLLAELRQRHPALEIESCASGGGRVDLGVLELTDRVWTSDTIDALERQQIQRYTSLLVPPEMMGAHIGAERAHTTGRRHDLAFRAGTAVFGHLGIEWDLTEATAGQREELAGWIAFHRGVRALLHTGAVVHGDHPDPALTVHGVVAPDGSDALFALTAVTTGVAAPPRRVLLPGLDPAARYRVEIAGPAGVPAGTRMPPWLTPGPAVLPGAVLTTVGVEAPALFPEQLLLLRVTRI
ncbi:alpha-galactosidase [Galbitalea sp. SE-J8]|uniref:alpha-galactosidase n=1 Tax=Galbitalea sp. SE-J8 TaxID=3054952 RepID=UPI00259CE8D8|nr:alpha-galactosidase [Galbitalea sp. SE-J8]MDM4764286.1 alpha-galactosidase [Galbitalea sp. SE-J8]